MSMTLANAYEPHVQKVSLSVHTIIYYIHLQPIDSDVAWYLEIDPPCRNYLTYRPHIIGWVNSRSNSPGVVPLLSILAAELRMSLLIMYEA